MTFVYKADPVRGAQWARLFAEQAPDTPFCAAVLDVADPEPLAADHPLWRHARVMLTPHIASMTQPESAVEVVLDNLRRHREGAPLVGLVDRSRGY